MDSHGQSREHLLDAAERLFMRKGYEATTLRDISAELGLSHASLYYHFPEGKASLFEAVTERNVGRHGIGLAAAIESGGPYLRGRLLGVASWLLSQHPMDLIRMTETDMPALPEDVSRRLMRMVYEKILVPLTAAFGDAVKAGQVDGATDAGLMAGAYFGLIESLLATPPGYVKRPREEMATALTDVLLRGLGYTEGERR